MKKDRRGKHTNCPHKLTVDLKEKVRAHTSSFPAQKSHYSTAKNRGKKFLPEGLSVSQMYNLFLEGHQPEYLTYLQILDDCRQQQIECTKPMIKPLIVEKTYRNIFDSEFNLVLTLV